MRDEPIPDHILDEIERKVGPIRLTRPNCSTNISVTKQNARVPVEAQISLEDFVKSCGGLLAASLKLGVSTTTIQKLLSGLPASSATTKKVFRALRDPITCTKSEDHFLSLQELITLGGISPSTIRKIQQYDGPFYKAEIRRKSSIAADASHRSEFKELVITNFPVRF